MLANLVKYFEFCSFALISTLVYNVNHVSTDIDILFVALIIQPVSSSGLPLVQCAK